MPAFEPPGNCPNCGEFVPARAPSCPHCGADSRTAWSDDTYLDALDLPDELPSYDRIVEQESLTKRPPGLRACAVAGLVLLLVLALAGLWWRGW